MRQLYIPLFPKLALLCVLFATRLLFPHHFSLSLTKLLGNRQLGLSCSNILPTTPHCEYKQKSSVSQHQRLSKELKTKLGNTWTLKYSKQPSEALCSGQDADSLKTALLITSTRCARTGLGGLRFLGQRSYCQLTYISHSTSP